MKLSSRIILTAIIFCLFGLALFAAVPSIEVDSPKAGPKNRTELLTIASRYVMPSGVIEVDSVPTFSRPNAGLFFTGNLTTIRNNNLAGNWVTGRALAIRPGGDAGLAVLSFYETKPTTPLPANQCGWLFDGNGSDGQMFYPSAVLRVGPGQVPPASALPNFMRAYKAVPFRGTKSLDVPAGHGFVVGDDVFATDGPLINEVVPEYRRIIALRGADVVLLDKALTRHYKQGSLVGGPLARRMTFQGIKFTSATWGPVLIQQACDVKFTDCTFDQALEWTSVIGCGRIEFVNCSLPSGLGSSTSHDVKFRNCTIRRVVGEQAAYDFVFENCRIGPDSFDSKVQCTGWTVTECVTSGGFFVYDGWTVRQHIAYGQVVIRGRGCVVRDLWSAGQVLVQGPYQGAPPLNSTNVLLDSIVAPSIHVEAGTSGVIRNRTCPVTGDLSGWTITPRQ